MKIPQFCPKSSICSWLRFVCRDPCEMWNWFGIVARYWVSILAGDGLELGTRASAATMLMWLCLHAFPFIKRSEMYINKHCNEELEILFTTILFTTLQYTCITLDSIKTVLLVLWDTVIMWSNISYHTAQHCPKQKLDFELTTDTQYLTLMGELWDAHYEDVEEGGPHYSSIALF